jgi:photosystem I subunit 10
MILTYTTLLAVASATVPTTLEWSPKVAVVMIICNILAIAFGKMTISKPSEGPGMPSPQMFGGFGLGAVLGTASFGHVLGAGVILGLASLGAL